MQQLKLFLAILALTCIAFLPPAARSDGALDDLDVSLVVLDDASDLSAELSEMRGPDDDDNASDDHEVERDEETVADEVHDNDDFEDHTHNDEDYFEDEDDFEDGDDVDTDEPHADIVG